MLLFAKAREVNVYVGVDVMKEKQIESERSNVRITKCDLVKLGKIAKQDREDFFSRHPRKKAVHLCTALCQGAALHYVNGKSGVKDFDVWSFYCRNEFDKDYPPRRIKSKDFGKSKFGVRAKDKKNGYIGRRVDLLGRSIKTSGENLIYTIRRYLGEGKTASSRALSKKAVVLIEPPALLGKVIWPQKKGT
jgi:hypothetical protein